MTNEQLGKTSREIRRAYGVTRPITSYEVEMEVASLIRKEKAGTLDDRQFSLYVSIELATGISPGKMDLPYVRQLQAAAERVPDSGYVFDPPASPIVIDPRGPQKTIEIFPEVCKTMQESPKVKSVLSDGPELPTIEHLHAIGQRELMSAIMQWQSGAATGKAWHLIYPTEYGFDFIRRPLRDGETAGLPYTFHTLASANRWRSAALDKLKRNS